MKKRYLSAKIWFCGLMTGLLGFTTHSCISSKEYGTPYSDFTVSGKVTDADGNPIKGIQINRKRHTAPVLSEENGDYSFNDPHSMDRGEYTLEFKDIDGDLNGSFEDTERTLKIDKEEYTGGEGWFSGYVKRNLNVTLDKKQKAE